MATQLSLDDLLCSLRSSSKQRSDQRWSCEGPSGNFKGTSETNKARQSYHAYEAGPRPTSRLSLRNLLCEPCYVVEENILRGVSPRDIRFETDHLLEWSSIIASAKVLQLKNPAGIRNTHALRLTYITTYGLSETRLQLKLMFRCDSESM
jgi:hypothetical protein